jgi:hypothetical protein
MAQNSSQMSLSRPAIYTQCRGSSPELGLDPSAEAISIVLPHLCANQPGLFGLHGKFY